MNGDRVSHPIFRISISVCYPEEILAILFDSSFWSARLIGRTVILPFSFLFSFAAREYLVIARTHVGQIIIMHSWGFPVNISARLLTGLSDESLRSVIQPVQVLLPVSQKGPKGWQRGREERGEECLEANSPLNGGSIPARDANSTIDVSLRHKKSMRWLLTY